MTASNSNVPSRFLFACYSHPRCVASRPPLGVAGFCGVFHPASGPH